MITYSRPPPPPALSLSLCPVQRHDPERNTEKRIPSRQLFACPFFFFVSFSISPCDLEQFPVSRKELLQSIFGILSALSRTAWRSLAVGLCSFPTASFVPCLPPAPIPGQRPHSLFFLLHTSVLLSYLLYSVLLCCWRANPRWVPLLSCLPSFDFPLVAPL